jgi:hypothetical protein
MRRNCRSDFEQAGDKDLGAQPAAVDEALLDGRTITACACPMDDDFKRHCPKKKAVAVRDGRGFFKFPRHAREFYCLPGRGGVNPAGTALAPVGKAGGPAGADALVLTLVLVFTLTTWLTGAASTGR